ncbi:MAG: ornithine carbamoyltransferase [Rhodospirillaceae bacterium]|nr:ornithine carbamoyltransferase [Rhodospirillaceae bacterium]
MSDSAIRHFLDLDTFEPSLLRAMVEDGKTMKLDPTGGDKPLVGKTLAMIFEKPSTRTRVSFEVGMKQLGGDVVVLNGGDLQFGHGETIADTARVLSRYVDCIMMRTYEVEKIQEMSQYATVPVINGLTDSTHPCQLLADVMAYEEHRGPIAGKIVAWSGDGNNMAASWIHASVKFGFELRIACPAELAPDPAILDWARKAGGKVTLLHDAEAAVTDADCVVTDTWVSMGDDDTNRHNMLAPFRVDETLMAKSKSDAVFMHCLPAHRGEEMTDAVIDGPQSIVWDEAENRLHSQKAILAWCMGAREF